MDTMNARLIETVTATSMAVLASEEGVSKNGHLSAGATLTVQGSFQSAIHTLDIPGAPVCEISATFL